MDPEESSIERLKRNLYSRNEKLVPKEKRTPVSPHEVDVRQNWGDDTNFNFSPEAMAKKNNSFFNKFLIGSLVFFAIALGIAVFIFYGGLNMISSNNLDINIVAPSSISSGEELNAGLSIVNGNRTDLEEVSMYIDYPQGVESVGEDTKTLSHEKITLGTISKGKTSDYSIRALLFGEKDSIKTFSLRLEYKVKGSNAVFSKEKTFDVSISSSPLIMDVVYPKEISSGQIVTISVSITSNSSVPVKNTLVKFEYPYGFTYKDSDLIPYKDNTVWNLGDMKDGDKKTINIRGILVGQNLEDRSFRISSGSQSADKTKDFDTPLAAGVFTLGIRKSFFDLNVVTVKDNVSTVGARIPVSIKWQNTLPDKILNARIEATMSGNIFDRNKVSVSGDGFYRSIDDTVVWDKTTKSDLFSILPGDSNQANFSMGTIEGLSAGKIIKNPHIDIHVVVTGDRSGADNSTVKSEKDVTVKISSVLGVKAKTYRNVGPFTNSGPIPPSADKETTYTISWILSNTTNDIKGATVSATLPPGVVWKDQTSPASEKINYDSVTNMITWVAGNVSSGIGFTYAPREVSFKVGITPSINQVGAEAPLISSIKATAADLYTDQTIYSDFDAVTTRFADATFSPGMERVIK